MSADNWAVCPRCKARHEKAAEAVRREMEEAYGKVPLPEWQVIVDRARAAESKFDKQDFREDYEIYGAEDGEVSVSYRGNCTTCGLSGDFTFTKTIEGVNG